MNRLSLGVQSLREPELRRLSRLHSADRARGAVADARAAGFDATGDLVESGGGVWRALADAAGRSGAALIVCGSRGRGAVASTVLGSVSSGLLHNAETPTLLVRERTDSPAPG